MKFAQLIAALAFLIAVPSLVFAQEIKLKREAVVCRSLTYLGDVERLQRRGDEVGLKRYLNTRRCREIRSTTKVTLLGNGYTQGRNDFLKVDYRGDEYWVQYRDVKT